MEGHPEPEGQSEISKFWRDQELNNLELLRATFINHSFAKHTHETFAIGTVVLGAETFAYRSQVYEAPAGSVVVVHPGEVHTGHASTKKGWTYRMLYPDPALLQEAFSQATGQQRGLPLFPRPVIQDEYLSNLLLRLHADLEKPLSTLEKQSRLLWVFGQLALRHAEERQAEFRLHQEHWAVSQARDYLEACYSQNVSLEQLAAVAGLSRYHLLRVFRKTVGLPPHSYQTMLRIAKAKKRLALGESIVQVALETGFTDQSHFTHQFKRITGVTPAQYKAQ